MAEWFSHVLFAYAIFTIARWPINWIDTKWVAVGMIGALLPDLNRLELVLPGEIITSVVGIEFGWLGLHTIAGVTLLAGIGALLFRKAPTQQRAFPLLLGGALSHLILDLPQRYADGHMLLSTYAFPLPVPRPPTPGWYSTPDRWVAGIAVILALLVFVLNHLHYRSPPKYLD